MVKKSNRDELFAKPQQLVDFIFDERVAGVFPDMIRRSVPGYENIIAMIGVIAENFVQTNTRVYDLGCSLGAATLSMLNRVSEKPVEFIAIDNAEAMIESCRNNLEGFASADRVRMLCADVSEVEMANASMVVMNFTLQFIPREKRDALIQKIYDALVPGGVLVLSEKITFSDEQQRIRNEALHMAFKAANGYSELEIAQKRSALENVLIPETLEVHIQRLHTAGFTQIDTWFRCFNFVSLLAIK